MLIFQQEERGYTVFLNDESAGKGLSILEFGYSRILNGALVGPRIRNDYLIHFVLNGSGKFEGQEIGAGDGFMIFPGKLHTFSVDPGSVWEHCWVSFSGDGAEKLLFECGVSMTNHTFSFGRLEEFREAVNKLRQEKEPSELMLKAFFYYMLALREDMKKCSDRPVDLAQEYVEKAVSLIRSSYMEPVKIAELADRINISQKYLWKLFMKNLGMSPQKYLLQVRMEEALKYLRNTNLTVEKIARSVGYGDVVSFLQNFKRYTGVTPTEYRRSSAR